MQSLHGWPRLPHEPSRWLNLREEIAEIFSEAQDISRMQLRAAQIRILEAKAKHKRKKLGFNARTRGGSFYAKQRAKYSHWRIPKLPPYDRKARSGSSKGKQLVDRTNLVNQNEPANTAWIWSGSQKQIDELKTLGWF